MTTDLIPIRRALISVSDKTGLLPVAHYLHAQGIDIISTGGTAQFLKDNNIRVIAVDDITQFPEMMDGRVKTLHPKIHGGILANRANPSHLQDMTDHGITAIDLVIVNLYPFESTPSIETIDVGGPCMIRAAAKNHHGVTIITDPDDYADFLQILSENHNQTSLPFRQAMAAKAFARTAAYDSAIAAWMTKDSNAFPKDFSMAGTRLQPLRYGENPHQSAALYKTPNAQQGICQAVQIQGKELSYNNINDTDAAFELVSHFDAPAVAIIKHANPCGVAIGDTLHDAYKAALRCDPVSAFGGIIAVNRPLDAITAAAIIEVFSEVIIAPAISEEAAAILATKKNLRVLITGQMLDITQKRPLIKPVSGGFLVQDSDNGILTPDMMRVVTNHAPAPELLQDLQFAFTVCKMVKSNAIVFAKHTATLGIGAGQMSRIDSTQIATAKANMIEHGILKGAVMASDAFFPFPDNVEAAAKSGIAAIIQPGGSIKDNDVIQAANDLGIAMIFTGMRHFRH